MPTLADAPGMLAAGRRRAALEGLGVVVAVAALWATMGIAGVAAGAAVAATWLFASTVYAVAVGQVCVVVLLAGSAGGGLPADPGAALELVAVQAGLAAPLVATLFARWTPRVATVATMAFVVAVAALSTAVVVEAVAAAALVLAGGYAVTAYGLYRYELVRVGHVAREVEQ